MSRSSRYSPKLRERVVRMVFDRREDNKSEWAIVTAISTLVDMSPETLRTWFDEPRWTKVLVRVSRPTNGAALSRSSAR